MRSSGPDIARLFEHVFGQREYDGTGPAGGGGLKRRPQRLWNVLGMLDLTRPFRQRRKHFAEFNFLKRFTASNRQRHLPDEENHRSGIMECGMYADTGMRGAWAASDHADSGASCHLPVGLRHVGSGAFVLGYHNLDVRHVIKSVEKIQITFAGNAKYPIDAVCAERLREHPATAPGCRLNRVHLQSSLG